MVAQQSERTNRRQPQNCSLGAIAIAISSCAIIVGLCCHIRKSIKALPEIKGRLSTMLPAMWVSVGHTWKSSLQAYGRKTWTMPVVFLQAGQ